MVNSSQRLESEQFKLLSQRVSENVEELISTVTQYIEDTIFVDISPALHADLYASVHANISNLVLLLQGKLELEAVHHIPLPEGVVRFARSCARHGYSVTTLTLAYHQGQNSIERAVLVMIQEQFAEQESASSVTDHFELLEEAMHLCHEFLLIVQGKVVELYNEELELLSLPGNTATLEMVSSILTAPESAPSDGEVENYSLNGRHIAGVLWTDPQETLPAETSVELAQRIARFLGSKLDPLIVFPRPGEMWLWVKNPAQGVAPTWANPLGQLSDILPEDTKLAFGPSASGVSGFAYSHSHALRFQQLALKAACSVPQVIDYTVPGATVAAAFVEQVDVASNFVRLTLGELALRDPNSAILRQSARMFLLHGTDEAARLLHTHPNTVKYRNKRFRDILDRDSLRSSDIQLALDLTYWYGESVLWSSL